MASQLFNIGAILLSAVFFLMGNGLVGTLTPVSAHLAGFSDLEIGFMGACYFAGFVAGCVIAPTVLARVGHARTFAVSAALLAVSVLIQPVSISPTVWFLLRAIAGFCIAGLFMALESWLNDRADNRSRGRLLSFYVMVNLSSLVAGQWLLLIGSPDSFQLFTIGAIFYCLCLIPVGLTALPQPHVPETTRLRPRRLFAISPVGAAGCMTVGLANGAFWTLAPVYAQSLGFLDAPAGPVHERLHRRRRADPMAAGAPLGSSRPALDHGFRLRRRRGLRSGAGADRAFPRGCAGPVLRHGVRARRVDAAALFALHRPHQRPPAARSSSKPRPASC